MKNKQEVTKTLCETCLTFSQLYNHKRGFPLEIFLVNGSKSTAL